MARKSRAIVPLVVRAPATLDDLIDLLDTVVGRDWVELPDGELRDPQGRNALRAIVDAENPGVTDPGEITAFLAVVAGGSITDEEKRLLREFTCMCERERDLPERAADRARVVTKLNPRKVPR